MAWTGRSGSPGQHSALQGMADERGDAGADPGQDRSVTLAGIIGDELSPKKNPEPQGTQKFTEEEPRRFRDSQRNNHGGFFPLCVPVSSVVKILTSDAETPR